MYYSNFNGKNYFNNTNAFNSFLQFSKNLIDTVLTNENIFSDADRTWLTNFISNLPDGWNTKPIIFYNEVLAKQNEEKANKVLAELKGPIASNLLKQQKETKKGKKTEYKIPYEAKIFSFAANNVVSKKAEATEPYLIANILSEVQCLEPVYSCDGQTLSLNLDKTDVENGNVYLRCNDNGAINEDKTKNGWHYVLDKKGGYFTRTVKK